MEHRLFHGINQIVNVVVSTRLMLEACLNVSVTQVTDSLSSTDSLCSYFDNLPGLSHDREYPKLAS